MDDPDHDPELRPRRVLIAIALAASVVALTIGAAAWLLGAWGLPLGGESGSAALVRAIPEPRLQTAPQQERQQGAAPEFRQQLGAHVPTGLRLRDADGRPFDWRAVAAEGRPLVLLPAWYRCDMLCGMAAHGALEALADTGLPPQAWRLVVFSVDPRDGPREADALRTVYRQYAAFARPAVYAGNGAELDLLSGSDGAALAKTIGFDFQRDATGIAHPAGLVVLTPDGTVSKYLLGLRFDAPKLRAALVEASQGHVGTLVDRLLLACSHFEWSDHDAAVMGTVRALVLLSVAGLVGFVLCRRRRPR